jgi:hypothetical protein
VNREALQGGLAEVPAGLCQRRAATEVGSRLGNPVPALPPNATQCLPPLQERERALSTKDLPVILALYGTVV